jgi:hypothetical protein
LTWKPSLISLAARFATRCRTMSAGERDLGCSPLGLGGGVSFEGARVVNSICFGSVDGTMRSTYIPGRWMAFGEMEPIGTIFSAWNQRLNR